MKVYVSELPKNCEECPMCRSGKLKLQRKGRYIEAEQCVFGQYKYHTIDDEIDTCPLQSLSDYTKQVRKEVCDKIREWHDEECESLDLDSDFDVGYSGALSNLCGVLDQIEKGE